MTGALSQLAADRGGGAEPHVGELGVGLVGGVVKMILR